MSVSLGHVVTGGPDTGEMSVVLPPLPVCCDVSSLASIGIEGVNTGDIGIGGVGVWSVATGDVGI